MPMFLVNCWYTSGHEAAGVAQRVPVVHGSKSMQLLVPGDLVRTRAHVGRARRCLLSALILICLLAADPGLEGAVGELAPVGGAPVGELVHAVVEADEHGRARAVDAR